MIAPSYINLKNLFIIYLSLCLFLRKILHSMNENILFFVFENFIGIIVEIVFEYCI